MKRFAIYDASEESYVVYIPLLPPDRVTPFERTTETPVLHGDPRYRVAEPFQFVTHREASGYLRRRNLLVRADRYYVAPVEVTA
jgi:hypothetical protein